MENIFLLISSLIILVPIILFVLNRKYFYYSIIIIYTIIGQTISAKLNLFNLTINPSMLFGFIVFALTTVDCFLRPSKNRPLEITAFIFIIYALLITSLFSTMRFEGISWVLKIATWLFVLLSATKVFSEDKDLYQICNAVSIAALIMIVSFILSRSGFYGGSQVYETGVMSYGGGFSSGKTIAYYLAITIPILALRAINKSKGEKYISYILIVSSIVVIILTFVRAPIVALLIGFLSYQYFNIRHGNKRYFISLAVIFFIAFSIFCTFQIFNKSQYTSRWVEMGSKISEGNVEKVGSGRVGGLINFGDYYLNKANMFQRIFGTGLGSSYYLLGNKKFIHNDFAEILMGCGIIGFVLYLFIIVSILKLLLKILKSANTPNLMRYVLLALSNFFVFLTFNMTNVTSGVAVLIPWALFTGAVIGVGQTSLKKNISA